MPVSPWRPDTPETLRRHNGSRPMRPAHVSTSVYGVMSYRCVIPSVRGRGKVKGMVLGYLRKMKGHCAAEIHDCVCLQCFFPLC